MENNNINSISEFDLEAAFKRRPVATAAPAVKENPPNAPQVAVVSEPSTQQEDSADTPIRKHKDAGTKTKKERSYQTFSAVCDKVLVRKVKAIAKKEGLDINDVVQAMYIEGINSYEKLHGAIDSDQKPKSAKDVLFAR